MKLKINKHLPVVISFEKHYIFSRGLEAPDQPFAAQLVGFSAASIATRYCIDAVRLHVVKGPIVAFERFITEPIESK